MLLVWLDEHVYNKRSVYQFLLLNNMVMLYNILKYNILNNEIIDWNETEWYVVHGN